MVAQVGALRVTVGADITGLQAGMARAQREVQRGAAGMQKSVGTVSSSFKSLAAVGGISLGWAGLAMGVRAFLSIADASKSLTAQIKLATAEYGSFGQAQKDVQRIAEITHSDLSATANLYAVFQRNSKELGISQAQAARATETVTKTFKISGATAAEATGGLRQFLQALQSGQLRGEEFNSVMENAPRLARLLADSLGVTIGQLRAMAEAGEITGDKLVAALTDRKFTEAIDKEFSHLPVTFDQAMGQIYNAAVVVFGEFDSGGQFSTALSNFVTGGTQGFSDLGDVSYDFGATIRSLLDTLDSVKAALGILHTDGIGSLVGLKSASISLRDALSEIIGIVDGMANAFANLYNAPGNLIRAARGKYLVVNPVNMRGKFDKANRAADLRRIMGAGLNPAEWPSRLPPPRRVMPTRAMSSARQNREGSRGPSEETLAKRAQAEMERKLREDAAYEGERRRNQIAILEADKGLAATADEQAEIGWIAAHRMPPPSISRITPTTMTNRLRLRPVLLRDAMPTTAPMIASGMISQLAQPSSGRKATSASTSATAPMISETRLSIDAPMVVRRPPLAGHWAVSTGEIAASVWLPQRIVTEPTGGDIGHSPRTSCVTNAWVACPDGGNGCSSTDTWIGWLSITRMSRQAKR